ncbi:MFS transporter [Nonomuraea sp. NPDC050790]|uniref:MFS transporter n=1 Tax=Nonomuraea sp. NPDC050790 TaxID=3364371 RepID=UPI0037A9A4CA
MIEGDSARASTVPRPWLGLMVLALPTLLLALDVSVLFLALPHLSADLGANGTQQLWIMDIYGFMIAGLLVTMGTLGDRIGRRKLLMIGAAAFGVASILAAFSTSTEMLIASRAFLGIAGATLMPSTMALISTMFPDPGQRASALGVWLSCFLGGTALGPLVGGVLVEAFWWGAAFLLGVPIMALLLVAAPRLLPECRDPRAGNLDLRSVLLSLAAILPVVYGLKELARIGLTAPTLLTLSVGLIAGVIFVRRQRRLASPLLNLSLFASRSFSAALLVGLMVGAMVGGMFLLVAQHIQLVEGRTPVEAGLWLVPGSLAMAASSLLVPRLARTIRPARVIAGGLLISAAGFGLMSYGNGVFLTVGFIVANVGLGPLALTYDLVLGSAPSANAGAASSLNETSGELGLALGIAGMGSLAIAVYRGEAPASLPEAARENLAAAVAADLPADLLNTARNAFDVAMHVAAAFGTGVFTVLALVTILLLRHVPPSRSSEHLATITPS